MKKNWIYIILILVVGCRMDSTNMEIDDIYVDYQNVYIAIQDSINVWRSDSLGKVLYLITEPNYQVDSVIIFNSDSSRFFTTVNKKIVYHLDSKMDYINEFGGAYIEDEWYYYFKTTTMPVSRLMYKDSLYKPYTFDELSYISHKGRFGSMLNRKEDGSIVLNEKSFNRKFFDLKYGRSYEVEKAYRDERLIEKKHNKNTRGKLKKKTIDEIKAKMAASVRPPEPVKEVREKSWWDNLFSEQEEVKIFESEAWKNRKSVDDSRKVKK